MGGTVRQERAGAVLVLVIDHPPAGALSQTVRAGLAAGLDLAASDSGIGAVVIRSAGRGFSTGADLSDWARPLAPALPDLCARVEASPRPVIVALHGAVTGGGLELALAAHLRVAHANARLGLPDVHLGRLPGAGGTQRLPRLIGAEQALRLMLSGRPVRAAEALAMGLLDHVVEGDVVAAALARAQAAVGGPVVPTGARRDGMRDAVTYQAAVAVARKAQAAARLPAPRRIVDCVEAALLLPLEQGLAFERAADLDLAATPEAEGLLHSALAERRLAHRPEARAEAAKVASVGVWGAESSDLALAALAAGCRVVLGDEDRTALVAALERIAARQEKAVQTGRMTADAREAEWARLEPALGATAFAGTDLLLAQHPPPGLQGPLVVALGGEAPGLAVHLAPDGRLAEVVIPPGTAPARASTLLAFVRRLGRLALPVARPGGVGGRLLSAGRRAAAQLVVEGVEQERVRATMELFGFGALVPTAPDPRPGVRGQGLPPEQITRRIVSAMANEGARLLGEGAVRLPSDIDLAALGQGFPRWEGGPMLWAQRRGLLILRRDLTHWAETAPQLYTPAPLIEDLIRDGGSLAALNGD
jgi:3-hydroxyacyl-CoA dehydrogenase